MKTFKSVTEMVNSKANESLKNYINDQPESIDWSISGLRYEISKERQYQAKKVQRCYDTLTATLNGVSINQPFIKNFGVVI